MPTGYDQQIAKKQRDWLSSDSEASEDDSEIDGNKSVDFDKNNLCLSIDI